MSQSYFKPGILIGLPPDTARLAEQQVVVSNPSLGGKPIIDLPSVPEGSNEIGTAPEVLRSQALPDCIATGDAANTPHAAIDLESVRC